MWVHTLVRFLNTSHKICSHNLTGSRASSCYARFHTISLTVGSAVLTICVNCKTSVVLNGQGNGISTYVYNLESFTIFYYQSKFSIQLMAVQHKVHHIITKIFTRHGTQYIISTTGTTHQLSLSLSLPARSCTDEDPTVVTEGSDVWWLGTPCEPHGQERESCDVTIWSEGRYNLTHSDNNVHTYITPGAVCKICL